MERRLGNKELSKSGTRLLLGEAEKAKTLRCPEIKS
jgi:hypothetical protein